MIMRIIYLVRAFGVPPSRIINSDQTGVHLLPVSNSTWTQRGKKDVRTVRARR